MRWILAAAAVLVLLGGCSPDDGVQPEDADPPTGTTDGAETLLPPLRATVPGGQTITFDQYELGVRSPDGDETVQLRVYDADDGPSRGRGLMQVESLPDGTGMLFRFGRPQEGGFWMKNTILPLSIAFADERGVINDVLDMEPCTADPCEIYRPDSRYSYALEVPRGAFSEQGITEGWTLIVPDDLPAAD